jgi:hypothetical protein
VTIFDINRSAAFCIATLGALLLGCVSFSSAAQSPAKLPVSLDWAHWTKEECDAVWTQSAWASRKQFWSKPLSASVVWSQVPVAPKSVELRSALPVREAILRGEQLESHYDELSPEQKLAFDKKYPRDMIEHENDPILLYIENDGGNVESYTRESNIHPSGWEMGHHTPHPAAQMALKLPDGTLVMPIKTEALQDDTDKNRIMYSFPRIINGKPVLSVNDQYLTFLFGQALNGGGRIRPLQNPKKFRVASDWMDPYQVSFQVKDLIYDGKLEY